MSTGSYETGAIELASGVYAYIQADGATDAGFIVDDSGVIVIDTLMTESLANGLLAAIRAVTDAPIRYIVNTHWHGDHVFGNAVLPPVPIIAHDTCREDLLGEWDSHRAFLRDLYPAAWPGMAELPAKPADLTFPESLTIHLGERRIDLRFFGRAHTRGDIVVHLPSDGVTFAGDVAFHHYIPNARDGFPTDWVDVAEAVEALGSAHVVPGHGPVGTTAHLTEMRECLSLINAQVKQSFDDGKTEAEALAGVNLGTFSSWGRQEDRMPTLVKRLYGGFRGELA
ncbi:MAG: MBL fold metallo-hydrolase [Dehalococcoidia bacterium]